MPLMCIHILPHFYTKSEMYKIHIPWIVYSFVTRFHLSSGRLNTVILKRFCDLFQNYQKVTNIITQSIK